MQTVLIPSLLCSPRLYEPVIPAVWSFGPVTIADTRHDDTIPEMAERLLGAISGPFAVVGVSMGGYVALEVMRQASERVLALALLSTSARPDTPEQIESRRRQVALVEDGQFDRLVDAAFPSIVHADNENDERLLRNWRAMAAEVGPEAFCRQQQAVIARGDFRDLLPAISCPSLIVHGTGDRLIAVENGEELAAQIPGARLELLENCGHSPTLERTDAVAQLLGELLSRASSE